MIEGWKSWTFISNGILALWIFYECIRLRHTQTNANLGFNEKNNQINESANTKGICDLILHFIHMNEANRTDTGTVL